MPSTGRLTAAEQQQRNFKMLILSSELGTHFYTSQTLSIENPITIGRFQSVIFMPHPVKDCIAFESSYTYIY